MAEDITEASVDTAPTPEEVARAAEPFRGMRLPKPRAVPVAMPSDPTEAPALITDPDNPYAAFRADHDAADAGLGERFKLNAVHSYYTGTLAGSARMAAMAHLVTTPDHPDTPAQMKTERDKLRKEYGAIIADLARYDAIRPWGTSLEGATALVGSIAGTLPSPESFAGAAAKGATVLGRTIKAAVQQGGIMAAVDPAVQWLQRQGGTATEYDPFRTVMAAGMGVIIGGGVHVAGEAIGAALLKRRFAEMAKEDPQFRGAREGSEPVETPQPSTEQVFDVLRKMRDDGQTPEVSVGLAETVKGKSDDDLRVLAKHVFDDLQEPKPAEKATETGKTAAPAEAPPVTEMAALMPEGNVAALVPLKEYAGGVVGREVKSVRLIGSTATKGTGRDLDILYDLGPRELPKESAAAEEMVTQIVESIPNFEAQGKYDTFLKVGDRYFHISSGAGQAVIENTSYGLQHAGKPSIELANSSGDVAELARRRAGGTLPMERQRPITGVSTTQTGTAVAAVPGAPSPQQSVAITSLQQQAMKLAEMLDFPIRQGRVYSRNALGTFNIKSGVVRTKEIADFEVVSHEAGHAIEAKVGAALTNLTNQFATELAPLVSNPAAYAPAKHVMEGFAEYIRRYMGNPAHAQAVAPNFTTAFRNFMEANHPDMLSAVNQASEAYRAYLNAPSADVIGAVIRSKDENPTGWAGVRKRASEDGWPTTVGKMLSSAYDAVLDQHAPITRAMREAAKFMRDANGALVDLKAADNPEVLARMLGRTQQAAVLDLMDGVRPYQRTAPNGPSLRAAIGKATGDVSGWGKWDEGLLSQFSSYLVARRAAVLWDKFNAGELANPPAAFSRGDAITAMADLERANPNLRAASDMVHAYTRELLRKQFEGHLIDAELYNKLLLEDFYVPFMRDMSDKPQAGGGGGASAQDPGMTQTVKRMKGSSRDIIDPLESIIMQTFLVNRTIRHNDLIRSFVRFFGKAGIEGGRYVEPLRAMDAKKYTFDLGDAIERKAIEKGMTPQDAKLLSASVSHTVGEDPLIGSFFRMEPTTPKGEPLVFYKEGGALKVARFMSKEEGHDLYGLVTALPTGLSDVVLQGLSASSGLLRSGIVTNPTFILTNFIRDQVAAGILRKDYIPFYHGTQGVAEELRGGQSAELYGYAGGVSAGAKIAPLEQAADLRVQALKHGGAGVSGYLSHRLEAGRDLWEMAKGAARLDLQRTMRAGGHFVADLHGLLELASITEAGTRNSIFETVFRQKRAQGLSDNEAMIEAAYQAQDILDFSRWGSRTQAVRALTPFVNAHMQGLDKARRTLFTPITRRVMGDEVMVTDRAEFNNALISWGKLLGVGGVLGAAWAALHQNDPIYRNASPEIKGTHFVTSLGGYMAVVPKPFELSLGFTAGEYAFQRFALEDQRAAMQFAESAYEVIKPPVPLFDNPAIKTSYELYFGKSAFSNRDLVPDQLKRLAPQEQYTDRTTSLAKALGHAIGVSPIKVDHAIGGYLGNWGRDIATMSSGVDEEAPVANWADTVFVRRFIKDPTRSSDVTTKFWGFMGQSTGKYNQAVNTYDAMVKGFRETDAKDFLDKLPASERAFVTMKSAANEDGKPAFGPNDKRLHPLQRAYDAVIMLNGVRREMDKNTFTPFETGGQQKLNQLQRGMIRDATRELAQAEMMNALVIMKEPGYGNQPMMALAPIMEKIQKLSLAVAEEIGARYATSRIYTTEASAKAYPELLRELNQHGSEADLGDLVADAQADGYEFSGERVRRPQKRRLPIAPAPANP